MYGLLTDDMGIYKKDKNGNPKYTFQYADVLVAQGVLDALIGGSVINASIKEQQEEKKRSLNP